MSSQVRQGVTDLFGDVAGLVGADGVAVRVPGERAGIVAVRQGRQGLDDSAHGLDGGIAVLAVAGQVVEPGQGVDGLAAAPPRAPAGAVESLFLFGVGAADQALGQVVDQQVVVSQADEPVDLGGKPAADDGGQFRDLGLADGVPQGLRKHGCGGGAGGGPGAALPEQVGGPSHGGEIKIDELEELRVGHITTHGGRSSSRQDSGVAGTRTRGRIYRRWSLR